MILIKDGIERQFIDEETIKIFKDAGWKEYNNEFIVLKEINKPKEEIKEQPKKTSKKTTKKKK